MDSLIDTWIFEDEIVEPIEYPEGFVEVSSDIEGAFGNFPPLTFECEGSFKIYYPDGRVIENPTNKELRAWVEEVKPQIPIYFIDDGEDINVPTKEDKKTCEGCCNIAFRYPSADMYPCNCCSRAHQKDYYNIPVED